MSLAVAVWFDTTTSCSHASGEGERRVEGVCYVRGSSQYILGTQSQQITHVQHGIHIISNNCAHAH